MRSQSKESQHGTKNGVLRLELEGCCGTSELGWRGSVISSSTSRFEGSKRGTRDRVRRSGRARRSLRWRSARHKTHRRGRGRTCLVGLCCEMHLRNSESRGAVYDSGAWRPCSGCLSRDSASNTARWSLRSWCSSRNGSSGTRAPRGDLRGSSCAGNSNGAANLTRGRADAASRSSRRSRSGIQGNVRRAVGDDTRVFRNVLGADTNEVLEGFTGLIVSATPSGNAVNDLLGKVFVLAVAGSICVVLAVARDLEPCVHALGQDVRRADRRIAGAGRLRSRHSSTAFARLSVACVTGGRAGAPRNGRLRNWAGLVGRRSGGRRSRAVDGGGYKREYVGNIRRWCLNGG